MSSHKRVTPRPLIGLLIFVGASVLLASARPTTADMIPIWLAVLGAFALVRVLGWTGQVFHEVRRTPTWTLAIPVFLAAGVFVGLLEVSWLAYAPSTLLVALFAAAGIAIAEEVVTRGILLVALRARYRELAVWFWTSLLFALVQGIHAAAGQSVFITLQEIALAFVLGSLLYGARRATGALYVPIALHALWDFTSSLGAHPGMAVAYGGLLVFVIAAARRVMFRIGTQGPHFARAS